jgi:hypothetical protein
MRVPTFALRCQIANTMVPVIMSYVSILQTQVLIANWYNLKQGRGACRVDPYSDPRDQCVRNRSELALSPTTLAPATLSSDPIATVGVPLKVTHSQSILYLTAVPRACFIQNPVQPIGRQSPSACMQHRMIRGALCTFSALLFQTHM